MEPIDDRNVGLEVPTPNIWTCILKEPNVLKDGEEQYFWCLRDEWSEYRTWDEIPKYLFDALLRYNNES